MQVDQLCVIRMAFGQKEASEEGEGSQAHLVAYPTGVQRFCSVITLSWAQGKWPLLSSINEF